MVQKYRLNAGIVVFNRDRKVLLCKRSDVAHSWQFPQGGIEPGETPSIAALRELKEETSIKSVSLIKTLETSVKYNFPPDILVSIQARGFSNIGQEMYWSLFYFFGDDQEINLQTEDQEFSAFYWGSLNEAYQRIVDWKKNAYAVAVKEFQPLIENFNFS